MSFDNGTGNKRKKTYVSVIALHHTCGEITPQKIIFDDGRTYKIDRVIESRRASSTKVDGFGTRYIIRIRNKETFLFHEEPLWFVEEIDCAK